MPADANLPFGDKVAAGPIQRVTITDVNGVAKLLAPYYTASFLKPNVTTAGSSGAWNTGTITLFTVTGLVLCRVYGRVTTLVTSTANTGTLALGIAGTTGLYIAATTANGSTNFIANSIWLDNAPTVLGKALPSLSNTLNVAQSNANIILTIATNNMTAGGMEIYCDWVPVSSDGNVVAATP